MSLLSAANAAMIRGSIRMPRVGIWSADVELDTTKAPTGAITIATADNAFTLVGTVVRSRVYQDTAFVRIAAGAAGLADPSRMVTPRAYQSVQAKQPLTYVLSQVGETLSATSDASVTSQQLPFWSVLGSPAKAALLQLLNAMGATSWRILPDGTVWAGNELYLAVTGTQFDVLSRHDDEKRAMLASQQPFLLPGASIVLSDDPGDVPQKVSYLVHEIEPKKIRTEVWFE